jgi:hypothetical protein
MTIKQENFGWIKITSNVLLCMARILSISAQLHFESIMLHKVADIMEYYVLMKHFIKSPNNLYTIYLRFEHYIRNFFNFISFIILEQPNRFFGGKGACKQLRGNSCQFTSDYILSSVSFLKRPTIIITTSNSKQLAGLFTIKRNWICRGKIFIFLIWQNLLLDNYAQVCYLYWTPYIKFHSKYEQFKFFDFFLIFETQTCLSENAYQPFFIKVFHIIIRIKHRPFHKS